MAQEYRGTLWSIGGVGLGLGLMYWLDPRSGRRRRATTLDKANHLLHETREAADVVARDFSHRTKGLVSKASTVIRPEGMVDDATVAARVRSHLGRVCSNAGAIQVNVRAGRVELKGPVLASELKAVLSCVDKVRGVQSIDNDLFIRDAAAGESALQGSSPRQVRWSLLEENWSPTMRFVAGSFGLGAALVCLPQKGLFNKLIGYAGALVTVRALTNIDIRKFFGVGAAQRAITFHKTIHVHAPIEEVYGFWNAFENFPRFMSHVREVRTSARGLSHWKVDGPGGFSIGWDAVVTDNRPNERIAWRSVEGAVVGNTGVVRFESTADGDTRVDIRLAYKPPAGAIGHAFAKLLGADPKKQLDDDLLRFKSLLEKGKATGRRETVTREELQRGVPPQKYL